MIWGVYGLDDWMPGQNHSDDLVRSGERSLWSDVGLVSERFLMLSFIYGETRCQVSLFLGRRPEGLTSFND